MRRCVLRLWMLAVVCSQAGCAPPVIEGGFDAPDPASKMYAIERAAESGDVSAVREIVRQLDSDDDAVRFLAIGALRRLTGETYGYDYRSSRIERQPAIRRWMQAVESGEAPGAIADRAGAASQ